MNHERGWNPDAQATFCSTLIDEWVRCGLTDVVVCPGSRSTPLALAVVADTRVRTHVHHDERSGSFMALGLAATSERPVAVITTSGTAVVQLHAAVVEADLAAVPLIVCSADRPAELRDIAAPQTIDQSDVFGSSLRWFSDVGPAEAELAHTWRSVAARAYAEAVGPRPGPVQLNLAFREPLVGTAGPLPAARGNAPWHRRALTASPRPVLEPELARARGLIVAGRGTPDPDAVARLAVELGWPLFADPLSRCGGAGRIDAFDALCRTGWAAENAPDVVLRVGGMPASKAVSAWLDAAGPLEVTVAAAGWWPDPRRSTALFLDSVPAAPADHVPVEGWLEAWTTADRAAATAIDTALADRPLSEPAVARRLTRELAPGSILVASSSMPIRDVEWYGVGRGDVRVHANRGANGIDGVVSTAVGAALSGARTTLLIGDVAFLHDINGLLGAAGRGIDLDVVVVDNDGGGIFSFLPQRTTVAPAAFELLFGTPHGLDLVAVAAAHGVDARAVSDPSELSGPERGSGVRVLVVRSDRDANVAVHGAVHDAVRSAIESQFGSSPTQP